MRHLLTTRISRVILLLAILCFTLPALAQEVTPEVTPEVTVTVIPPTEIPTETATATATETATETATIEVTPEVTDETTPEVTPEVTPEATDESTPEVTPEVTETVTPTVTPTGETTETPMPTEPPFSTLTLEGFAVLPADTFADGPPAGAFIDPNAPLNGRTIPFASQPVQGVSAIIAAGNGNYFVLSDNGFGARQNSFDYLLRFYEVSIDFTAHTVQVIRFVQLSDPNDLIPFPIVNEGTAERLLTGADFDPESFRLAPDGTFWFGEEFGPFLLHTDAEGRLIDAPFAAQYPPELATLSRGLTTIQSPDNPELASLADDRTRFSAANLPRSRGFEGLALSADGTKLYTLLESALFGANEPTRLLIQEFDLATKSFTDNYWFYQLSSPFHSVGELTAINTAEFLVVERDDHQGQDAAFKRIYRINLTNVRNNDQRTLVKTLVADLLAIHDATGLTAPQVGAIGYGPVFKFPFQTVESVYIVDSNTLLIANDNNFPTGSGRRPGQSDDTEFILVGLTENLSVGH